MSLNILYWLLAVGIDRCGHVGATTASGTSYALTSAVAYFLHRRFTFRSRNPVGPEVFRFALATGGGMMVALLLPYLLPGSSTVAYAAVSVATPMVNFLVYRVLVYAKS